MKKLNPIVCGIVLLMLAAFDQRVESRDHPVKVAQESNEPREPAKADTDQQEQYKKKVDDKLAGFRDRMRKLKDQVDRAGGKAKAELREAMAELDKKMAVAKDQFEKFKSASARTWEKAKSQMDAAIRDLERSYKRVAARLKGSGSEEPTPKS